jgi:DNA-binding protein HU-beta
MSKKKPLSRTEFVNVIQKVGNYETKKEADKALSFVIKALEAALSKGDNVSLIGFGNFEVKDMPARMGRNPKTGEEMQIKASKRVSFKVGKTLKDAVNQ